MALKAAGHLQGTRAHQLLSPGAEQAPNGNAEPRNGVGAGINGCSLTCLPETQTQTEAESDSEAAGPSCVPLGCP